MTIEIIAEVVYVLRGVYSIDRNVIKTSLLNFLSEVHTDKPDVLKLGLETYSEQNLDFVDCILFAYNRVKGYEIKTFDKKLRNLLDSNEM